MKRGELHTLSELKPGDRFYLASSKSKEPFEFIEVNSLTKIDVCSSAYIINGRPNSLKVRPMLAKSRVIYLRSVEHEKSVYA